jgi:hypothetical protein
MVSVTGSPPQGLRPTEQWHIHLNGIGPVGWAQTLRNSLEIARTFYPDTKARLQHEAHLDDEHDKRHGCV